MKDLIPPWDVFLHPWHKPSWKQPLYPAVHCHLYVNWVTLLTITLKCLNMLMAFTWEETAKNNSSVCVVRYSAHSKVWQNVLNNARATYLLLYPIYSLLTFAVLSKYPPTSSETDGLMCNQSAWQLFVSLSSKCNNDAEGYFVSSFAPTSFVM